MLCYPRRDCSHQIVTLLQDRDKSKILSCQLDYCFLTYPSIQDQDITMFTCQWQTRSHMAAHVGQALLYSKQPTHNTWHYDVPNYRISMFAMLACATVFQTTIQLLYLWTKISTDFLSIWLPQINNLIILVMTFEKKNVPHKFYDFFFI